MRRATTEIATGAFLLFGLACLATLALKLGEFAEVPAGGLKLSARFVSASGLRAGAPVEVGGVRAGVVERIELDPHTYEAVVFMRFSPEVQLQADTMASIRSAGLIGEKFLKISPGGDTQLLVSGDEITETESSVNLEELIGKYIFESQSSTEQDGK